MIQPWSTPPQTNAPAIFSSRQSSIYDPISSKIFYFGGVFENTNKLTYHELSYAFMFDTSNGAWGNQTLTGTAIPTERRYHTTTLCNYEQISIIISPCFNRVFSLIYILVPNSQSTVLLYGGEKKVAGIANHS